MGSDASVLGSRRFWALSGELRVGSARLGELALSLCGVGSFGEVDIGEQQSSWRFSSCEFGALPGSGDAAGSVVNVLGCAFAARLAPGLICPEQLARLTPHQDGHFASCLKARTGGEHQ